MEKNFKRGGNYGKIKSFLGRGNVFSSVEEIFLAFQAAPRRAAKSARPGEGPLPGEPPRAHAGVRARARASALEEQG